MSKHSKVNILSYFLMAPFLFLIFFLFRYQIVEGAKYQRIAEYNFVRRQTILPIRGEIFDRHFRPIAINQAATNLYILPAKVKSQPEVADFVSHHLPVSKEEVKELLFNNRFRSYQELLVYRDVSYEKVVEISENLFDYPSLFFKTEHLRHYNIDNHFTGYVSRISRSEFEQNRDNGYTNNCQIGKTGLEKEYESYLRGKTGYRILQVDSSGRNLQLFRDNFDVQAVNGSDMILTIDLKLQEYIESVFPEGYNGAVLVLDTKTGGVLSYVSRPVYDLNIFSQTVSQDYWANLVVNPSFPMMDRITMATYPPASLFKTVMTAVALDNNIINPSSRMTSCSGSFRYGNQTYRCWDHDGHGSLNLSDAIKESCNVYFFDLSLLIGLPLIEQFMRDNRLLERTGIDMPSERIGFFPSEDWYIQRLGTRRLITGHKINLSIGQGEVLLTPIQIGTFFNAIANDGYWKQPFLFSRLIGSETNHYPENILDNGRELDITPATISLIQNSLYRSVNERGGTGLGARVQGARVSGKTGTAQNPAGDNPHTWFAGYAGWDEPEITLAIIIENYPGTGGRTAAPLAGRIFKFYQDNLRSSNSFAENNNSR